MGTCLLQGCSIELDTRKHYPHYNPGVPLLQPLVGVGRDKLVSSCFGMAASQHPHMRRHIALVTATPAVSTKHRIGCVVSMRQNVPGL
jgi:hypothetical protein